MSDYYTLSPEQQAERLAVAGRDVLRQWNVDEPRLDLIKHRENAVFRVESDEFQAALRMHRQGYHTDDELRSELQWMQALGSAGIRVPEAMRTTSGEWFAKQPVDGLPDALQVDLWHWIDGEQLGSVEEGVANEAEVESTYRTLGELAARVHNQAASWDLPEGFTRHAWDADGLAGESPFWGRFWEIEAANAEQRGLLARARESIHRDLSALPKTTDTYSMIHADFAAENIMVDDDGVRLIDFDDAGFGWHLFELVTALIFIRGEEYFDRAERALIEGYRKHRSLTDEALELLPLFYLARSTTYVGWVHTRSETETAMELTPMIVGMTCELAEDYLSS